MKNKRNRMKTDLIKVGCLVLGMMVIANAVRAEQVTDLKAVHREGQTFLTWKEADSPAKEESLSFPARRLLVIQFRDKGPKIQYRVYRSDKPIATVEGLTPVGETGPLSCWNGNWREAREFKETDLVPRYVIAEGQPPLAPATGLYVHNPQGKGELRGYYAVTVATDGKEDTTLGTGNALKEPVVEKQGQGIPVLQSSTTVKVFNYQEVEPELRHYVRWEAPPYANRDNMPNDILVMIPKKVAKPAPVGLLLHCWGGSPWQGYGWMFNADSGAMFIAASEDPYDWWTGYHEQFGKGERSKAAWEKGVVRPYTQKRLFSLLDWVATQWEVDRSRVFVGGVSMGGSGAPMLAIRHPEKIAWAIGWVGVHVPHLSPTFKSSYREVYGDPEWGVKFEDGTPVWDYFNDVWYLRKYPARETPFITWSNGKNDGSIGWPQAVEFYKAMQETKRPHLFVWGQEGHGQRAKMPKNHAESVMPIDIRIEQSLPAFTKCSLDGNPGNGDPNDGDKEGSVNYWLYWETKDIVDEAAVWELTVGLLDKAPKDGCSVDLTPRRLQKFRTPRGAKFAYTVTDVKSGKALAKSEAVADENGLLTLVQIPLVKGENRVRITPVK